MNTRDATLANVRELSHFVGGKHVKGESGRFGEVFVDATVGLPIVVAAVLERLKKKK